MLTEFLLKRIGNQVSWVSPRKSKPYGELREVSVVDEGLKLVVGDVIVKDIFGDWTHFPEPETILVEVELLPDSVSSDGSIDLVSKDDEHKGIRVHSFKHKENRFH